MATMRQASIGRTAERLDEQYPSRLGRIILRYYGWFYSGGIAVTGATLFALGADAAAVHRVLAASLALFGFQALMEVLRYFRSRFYDSVAVSRFRAEVYVAAAAALVRMVGGIHSPFWLLFVLPVAFTAVYGDRSRSFKYFILIQILAIDALSVAEAGWQAEAAAQGLIYAAVFWALLESATWLYVMAHFRQEERLQHLELLKDSAQRLIPQRALSELAHEALEMALTLAGTHQGFLLILQRDSGRVLAHAIRGLSLSPGVTVQDLASRCRAMVEAGRLDLAPSRPERGGQFPYSRYFHDKIESALAVPIPMARGRSMAVLHVTSPQKDRFPTPVPSLLDVYAGQLATALDNTLSWEEQGRTLRHYGSLIELGQRLLEQVEPETILDQVVHYVQSDLPQVAGAYILVPDSRPDLYALIARSGRELGVPAPAAVPLHRLLHGSDDAIERAVVSVPEADAARWATIGVTAPPFASLLAAQLRVGAKLMGFLLLGATETHAFTPVDEVFLGNLAAHVALAYRNAELHQRQRASRARLTRILQEQTTWRLDQSLDALLEQMVRSAARSLGFGSATIDLYDPERGGYAMRAMANLPPAMAARLRGRVLTRDQVNRALHPQFRVGDADVYFIPSEARMVEVDWARYRQALGLGNARPSHWRPDDVLLVPLQRRDGLLLGLLTLDNPDDHGRPTDDDGHVYENLADQVVATLDQWHQNAKLRQLSETLALLIEETEVDALYQFIVRAGARLLEAEDCSLFLNNERSGVVEFEASSCIPKEMFERKTMPISSADGAGLTAYVAATGASLSFVGDEYKSHPAWEGRFTDHLDFLPSRGCRSLALVALRNPGGGITGVLKVENKVGLDANAGFTEFDTTILLPTLANAAAIAIERAHFYWRTGEVLVQKERDRLAGELHDLANVFHMGIMLRIEKLAERLGSASQRENAQALRQLYHASRYVFGELKKMHEETRHPILIQEGLIQALANYSRTINLSGVAFSNGIGNRLPIDVEHALYRVAQEALSNAKKHFQGITDREIRVEVALRREGSNTVMEVVDNGPGFDVKAEMTKPESFGLTRMMEIAEGIKARCEIHSRPGQGTLVRVTVPTQEKEEALPLEGR